MPKFVIKNLEVGILIIAIALRFTTPSLANVSYVLLAIYATRGGLQAILALVISSLIGLANPAIAAEASFSSIGRYLVILSASLSIGIRKLISKDYAILNKENLALLVILLLILVHSIFVSPLPDVSLLKAGIWVISLITITSAWSSLLKGDRSRLETYLYSILVALAILSAPLLAIPSIGYFRNGSGFQGLLNQPQAFGPVMAILSAWTTAKLLTSNKPSYYLVSILGCSILFIFLSEARTAAIALILGITFSCLFFSLFTRRTLHSATPGLFSSRSLLLIFGSVIAFTFAAQQIQLASNNFLSKSGRASVSGFFDAYIDSRGKVIFEMQDNVKNNPILGIGFGIASDQTSMDVEREPILGLPIGASIEKGVLPLAVLEELGIFGFIVFGIWIIRVLSRSFSMGVEAAFICATILALNFGESALLSVGGLGLLLNVFVGWILATRPAPRLT